MRYIIIINSSGSITTNEKPKVTIRDSHINIGQNATLIIKRSLAIGVELKMIMPNAQNFTKIEIIGALKIINKQRLKLRGMFKKECFEYFI